MKNRRLAFLLFCMMLVQGTWAETMSILFHAGRIDSLQRVTEAQKFVRKNEALQQNRLVPKESDHDLLEERYPEEDKVFIILNISVFPERSVAPSDYVLQVDGGEYACLGMASGRTRFFDFRFLEASGPSEVMLLFTCPASAYGATLKCAHAEIPIPPIVGLQLQKQEAKPTVETEAALEVGTADKTEEEAPPEKNTPVEK